MKTELPVEHCIAPTPNVSNAALPVFNAVLPRRGAIASKPAAKQEKQRRRLLPQSAFSIHAPRGSEVGRQFKIRIHPSAWLFFGKRNILHRNIKHGTFCIVFSTVSAPCKRRCSKKVEHKTWNILHRNIKHRSFCIAKNFYGIYVKRKSFVRYVLYPLHALSTTLVTSSCLQYSSFTDAVISNADEVCRT